MSQITTEKRVLLLSFLILSLALILPATMLQAQGGESIAEMNQKANELIRQNKTTEALPLLEKLVVAEPLDSGHQYYLGFGLLAQAANTQDVAARKAVRVRARQAFLKAKELGSKELILDALILGIPADGADGASFSENAAANSLMTAAEALFGQGKLTDALSLYQKALELDPKLYYAAVFSADVYTQQGNFALAETWYKKAIAIDPDRETAYRYSATPFMRQGKTAEARDRYIEAYITEPYSQFAIAGLTQWGKVTNTLLAHPAIDIPDVVSFDSNGNAKTNLDPVKLASFDDGSFAWAEYALARTKWKQGTFAKTFPSEKEYRHSLPEELEALRGVLTAAAADKRVKTLSPSLARLKKIDGDGLLEAYILIAVPDDGIILDFSAYLHKDRDKLRQYVTKYVLTGGGN